MLDGDPFFRRLERNAVIACLAMSAVALAIARGRPGPAVAVLAGGVLIGLSYWAIGLGLRSLERPSAARIVVGAALRFALLALFAYVMIARLGLHPLGLLAGASSGVAAASFEAWRLLKKKSREH